MCVCVCVCVCGCGRAGVDGWGRAVGYTGFGWKVAHWTGCDLLESLGLALGMIEEVFFLEERCIWSFSCRKYVSFPDASG